VLRTQMQAIYSTENIGHFGLNLAKYAHSPRRSAATPDLVVHSWTDRGAGARRDGLSDRDIQKMKDTAESITFASAAPWRPSATPRTAMWPPTSPTGWARVRRADYGVTRFGRSCG